MTIRKIINFLKTELAYLFKRPRLASYPYELIVESTNICQLKCPFCYSSKPDTKLEKGFMEFPLFKDIIDELGPYALHVFLHLRGEPLLHKEITKFIRYAHDANLATAISTNLSIKLTDKQIENLIDSGLDKLVISADGITPEIYQEYRIGGNFQLVIENIKSLVKKRKEKKSPSPHLEWQFLVMRQNEHQIEEAKTFIKKLGVDSISFGKINIPTKEASHETAKKWLPKNQKYRNNDALDKPDNIINGCWWLWRATVIHWNGAVVPCCFLYDKAIRYATYERPFDRIWNNSYFSVSRSLFSKNVAKTDLKTLCHSCQAGRRRSKKQ